MSVPPPGARITVCACRFGRGVFAAEAIPAGSRILTFHGPIITLAEANQLGDNEANPLQIGPDAFVLSEEPGVLVNHSCDPNAGFVGDVHLFAIRDIEAGEEIIADYSTSIGRNDMWTMICLCGAASCRRVVRSFHTLPPAVRARYLALGIVQRFLLEE